ncbi:MAG: S8 family serine peptidase [Aphanizomenon gracile PMC649.10]|nr:S8 family serine peptidase [Aphanizomenon gracile PMC649.10]
MKRITSSIFLATLILSNVGIFPIPPQAIAQTQENGDLFYLYKGQRIPLNQRQDAIAVSFKQLGRTRSLSAPPLYLQLQQDLQSGIRSTTPPKVTPLGENYALVNLPKDIQNAEVVLQQRIQQQPYVQTTLPVLTRNEHQEIIVVPNEIILSFQSQLSQSQRQAILQQNNLEIVRPLRFNRDSYGALRYRYLVKSTSASGTKILSVSNQLNSVKGVTSATPNFIQSLTNHNLETATKQITNMQRTGDWLQTTKPENTNRSNPSQNSSQSRSIAARSTPKSNLLGLAWHLDSRPLQQCLQEKISSWKSLQTCLQKPINVRKKSAVTRTDVRVTDAWKRSNGGRGVVVAVLDSLIQWDHPDLINNIYTVKAADKCPGEVHGWDFSSSSNSLDPCKNGDADTRISPTELAILGSTFQDTFQLSDAKLVQQYSTEALEIKRKNPDYSLEKIANVLRYVFRTYKVGGEFHGTYVSGAIAAKPQNGEGVLGVAPNAQILPVRLFGLNGSYSPAAYIEAIGYAADRGADIINLSLGSLLPSPGEEEAIADVLKANPKLVIVAAAGNENRNRVTFPAAYPGVISVGATNIKGNRASYSNYGGGLDLVAPGGDLNTPGLLGGIPTTGGTSLNAFWQGVPDPSSRWSAVVDGKGKYWWVEGTSFASPTVAGVVALMKGENKGISRERLVSILKSTASYQGLTISRQDAELYRLQRSEGEIPASVKEKQYFFGKGLVNADAAVQAVKRRR